MTTPVRLSLKDAAARHGVSYDRMHRAIKADELPAVKLGHWTVRAEDVEAWILRVGEPNAAESERAS